MPGICSSSHAYPISLDNQDVEFRGIGDRRFARLSSHHQAEYRYGGGIPACLVKKELVRFVVMTQVLKIFKS